MGDHSERIGQIIGDYRLLRRLGGGGFGDVYLAEQIRDGHQVAIKVLATRLTEQDDFHAFINEARVMRLHHAHIISLLDFGLGSEGTPFLVMEYVPNGTLRDRYPKGTRVPLATAVEYGSQVASALQYAHDQHLVHRDVKPENMLVRADDTILLSDFGIATTAHSTHSLRAYQGIGGTIPYMAPEQLEGKPRPASDQYALATVVYEWLAGRPPFRGTAVEIAMQHAVTPPPPLLAQVPDLPEAVETVLFQALAKDYKLRFASVQAFAHALQDASSPTTFRRADVARPDLTASKTPSSSAWPTIPPPPTADPPSMTVAPATQEPITRTVKAAPETAISEQSTPPITSGISGRPIPSAGRLPFLFPLSRSRQARNVLLLFLCFVLLIGAGSGGIWLVGAQQEQQRAQIATATALAVHATTAANVVPSPTTKPTATSAHANLLWSYKTGDGLLPTPLVANGMLYMGSDDHRFYAFDATCRSGCQPLWSYQTGSFIESGAAASKGMVYVGSGDHQFYAFDAACRSACQPLWSYQTGSVIFSTPAVANGVVYVGSADGRLYAFDATCRSDCQPLWFYQTNSNNVLSPTVGGGVVYVGATDNKLYAFDATCRSSCQPLWSYQTDGTVESTPAVANGMVYASSNDHKLYAFDATCRSTCQPLWTYQTGNVVASSPVVADGVVYMGSDDNKFYAFDAICRSACQPLWSYQASSNIQSSPVVANGTVYVGSDDGKFYAFDATCRSSCQPLWSYQTGSLIKFSAAVADGVVYVGSDALYALGAAT